MRRALPLTDESGVRRRLSPILALAAIALAVAVAIPPRASADFETGIDAPEFSALDESVRDRWFDETVDLGAGVVRVDLSWRQVATARPANPTDPFDPAYDFSHEDAAVREAAERGLDLMFTISFAPDYAEGPGRPSSASPGTWRPDPGEFAAFGEAVARRYSGNAGLPRVRYYEAWNEPNLPQFLAPQWEGKAPVSPDQYRAMLNAFYVAVKGVDATNLVIAGGNAPYGDPAHEQDRVRPLRFYRELLCLRGSLKRITGCEMTSFDIFAHHPINTTGGPNLSAVHPDDASTPDFKNVGAVLRAAERAGTVGGPRRHQLWATELWWESDPPDPFGVSPPKQARYIQEALYVLWRQGAKRVIYFLLRDDPFDPENPLASPQTGLFFENGTPKPAATAFSFPFVTDRASKSRLRAWGKAPAGGRLRIERRDGQGWRTIETVDVRQGAVFRTNLQVRGAAKLRARVGDQESLVFSQGGGGRPG